MQSGAGKRRRRGFSARSLHGKITDEKAPEAGKLNGSDSVDDRPAEEVDKNFVENSVRSENPSHKVIEDAEQSTDDADQSVESAETTESPAEKVTVTFGPTRIPVTVKKSKSAPASGKTATETTAFENLTGEADVFEKPAAEIIAVEKPTAKPGSSAEPAPGPVPSEELALAPSAEPASATVPGESDQGVGAPAVSKEPPVEPAPPQNLPELNSAQRRRPGKTRKPPKPRRKTARIVVVLRVILIVIIIACLTILLLWWLDGRRASEEYETITEEATTETATAFTVDFDALRAQNVDTVAWLRIPGTVISYPIVQARDNTTYLYRTFSGQTSLAGTIFLHYQNSADFSDVNSSLFGHHRLDGTMFAELDRIHSGDLGDDVRVYLYLPDGTVNTYAVFSAYITENDPVSIDPATADFDSFAGEMRSRSIRDFAVDPLTATVTDTAGTGRSRQVLTLSTCVANDDRRYLVHAVLIAVAEF